MSNTNYTEAQRVDRNRFLQHFENLMKGSDFKPMAEGLIREVCEKYGLFPVATPSPKDQPSQKTLRWVKASERLPEKSGEENSVIIRGTGFEPDEFGHAHLHPFVTTAFKNFNEKSPKFYFLIGHYSFLTNDNIEWLEETSSPAVQPDHVHVQLPSGGIARVDPNATPELLDALDKMVELAKEMPEPAPTLEGEIPEEIGYKRVPKPCNGCSTDCYNWQIGDCREYEMIQAHTDMPKNILDDILKSAFEHAANRPPEVESHIRQESYITGAKWLYHKMQEEIALYKNMWMIADKIMNELRLKVQELNKITNG